jgi:hypothetical protein
LCWVGDAVVEDDDGGGGIVCDGPADLEGNKRFPALLEVRRVTIRLHAGDPGAAALSAQADPSQEVKGNKTSACSVRNDGARTRAKKNSRTEIRKRFKSREIPLCAGPTLSREVKGEEKVGLLRSE